MACRTQVSGLHHEVHHKGYGDGQNAKPQNFVQAFQTLQTSCSWRLAGSRRYHVLRLLLERMQSPRDPSIPTLGPKVSKYDLHWTIWIPREVQVPAVTGAVERSALDQSLQRENLPEGLDGPHTWASYTPKYYNPYYKDPETGTPNFGKPAYLPFLTSSLLSQPAPAKIHLAGKMVQGKQRPGFARTLTQSFHMESRTQLLPNHDNASMSVLYGYFFRNMVVPVSRGTSIRTLKFPNTMIL